MINPANQSKLKISIEMHLFHAGCLQMPVIVTAQQCCSEWQICLIRWYFFPVPARFSHELGLGCRNHLCSRWQEHWALLSVFITKCKTCFRDSAFSRQDFLHSESVSYKPNSEYSEMLIFTLKGAFWYLLLWAAEVKGSGLNFNTVAWKCKIGDQMQVVGD